MSWSHTLGQPLEELCLRVTGPGTMGEAEVSGLWASGWETGGPHREH